MNRAAFCDATLRILAHRYRRFWKYCCLIPQNTRRFCSKRMDSSCPSANLVLVYESARRHIAEGIRFIVKKVKVKWSRYRPGLVQRVGRSIALLFHDRGTRRVWVVSITPRPHFTPGKEPVPILQEALWAPGPVWTGGKSRPHRDSIPDRPALIQSLYRLSYLVHTWPLLWILWKYQSLLLRWQSSLEFCMNARIPSL